MNDDPGEGRTFGLSTVSETVQLKNRENADTVVIGTSESVVHTGSNVGPFSRSGYCSGCRARSKLALRLRPMTFVYLQRVRRRRLLPLPPDRCKERATALMTHMACRLESSTERQPTIWARSGSIERTAAIRLTSARKYKCRFFLHTHNV